MRGLWAWLCRLSSRESTDWPALNIENVSKVAASATDAVIWHVEIYNQPCGLPSSQPYNQYYCKLRATDIRARQFAYSRVLTMVLQKVDADPKLQTFSAVFSFPYHQR